MEVNSAIEQLSDAGPAESNGWDDLSNAMGWTYFVLWSISYYPQIYENWKGTSVIGYSFDLLSLEFMDMTLYTIYNIGFFAFASIQKEYFDENNTVDNPVKFNDVMFGLHAIFCCFLLTLQCIYYKRGNQKWSNLCRTVYSLIIVFTSLTLTIVFAGGMTWVLWLSLMSYIKIILLFKFLPQIYLNNHRRSTSGFSIWLVLLDFAGGVFSVGQMFVDSANANDWTSLSGNPTKFLAGAVSVILDLILIYQHYWKFRKSTPYEQILEGTHQRASGEENEQEQV